MDILTNRQNTLYCYNYEKLMIKVFGAIKSNTYRADFIRLAIISDGNESLRIIVRDNLIAALDKMVSTYTQRKQEDTFILKEKIMSVTSFDAILPFIEEALLIATKSPLRKRRVLRP